MKRSILVMLACGMTMPGVWAGTVPTAMKAAELADNEVKTGGQFRVVRLEGEDTDSDLRPRQWDITVYDTIRGNHATTVRVKDGVVVSTAGAVRMLDDTRWSQFGRNFTGYDPSEIILFNRWNLDSSDALNKVPALPGMD